MIIPAYALGAHELWTPPLIRDALVLAFKVDRALPGGGSSAQSVTMGIEINDAWRYADAETPMKQRFRPSATEIEQMEILFIGRGKHSGLINGDAMREPRKRAVLIKWARWVSYGGMNPTGTLETDAEFSDRIGLSEWAMKRDRDSAAGIMAMQANEQKIVVWHAGRPERRRKPGANMHAAAG